MTWLARFTPLQLFIGFVSIASLLIGLWLYIEGRGYNRCKGEINLNTAETVIDIKEKQNEALRNRPDDDRLIDSLLKGSY